MWSSCFEMLLPCSHCCVWFLMDLIDLCLGLRSSKTCRATFSAVIREAQGNAYYPVVISMEWQGILQYFYHKWQLESHLVFTTTEIPSTWKHGFIRSFFPLPPAELEIWLTRLVYFMVLLTISSSPRDKVVPLLNASSIDVNNCAVFTFQGGCNHRALQITEVDIEVICLSLLSG